ncbi:2Fe-2S iron-sulfur cluster-binding protein [Buchnera aphidicola (Kurisakia onigurumii)]|uniref:2Fe-2S iron-sulfur cluster-binding protein n=1 Tax=Buchnera aphidicola TaxID=9 RepID=UPI0031B6A79A
MVYILFIIHKKKKILKKRIQSFPGESILDAALRNNIYIEHACEKSCACTTCHCYIIKGSNTISVCQEKEEDALDKAWNLQENSRLTCQAKVGNENIEVEIPYYSINYSDSNK